MCDLQGRRSHRANAVPIGADFLTRQRLVFLSPRFLFPADSGGKIRTTQILRGLKGGAFEVELLMPSSGSLRDRFASDIDSVCDELVRWDRDGRANPLDKRRRTLLLRRKIPVSVLSDWNALAAGLVRSVIDKKPDLIVFDYPHSAILAPESFGIPSVLFTHNVEAEIFRRHWEVARTPKDRKIWRDEYEKMQRFERDALSRFDTTIAVSVRDCDYFRAKYQVHNCRVVPTGVDTCYFSYVAPRNEAQVVFCGSMDWLANIDGIEYFHEEIWPLVRRRVPSAKMRVVGRSPPDELRKRIVSAAPEWEFTGFVQDIRHHVAGADAFVIPLRVGGGTRIKAFEAMAMGCPIVSTSIGIEGLPVIAGKHFLGADDPDQFAKHVALLLKNPGTASEISLSGRDLVDEQCGYKEAAAVFEQICLDTVRGQR